jgi:hypothetical protein
VPEGDGAIARMRLSLQAQVADKQRAVEEGWGLLLAEEQRILAEEMARTGIARQSFGRGPRFDRVEGPAFLVYYSPAFVRTNAPKNARIALRILAEVYKRARELWPLCASTDNAHSVTIRIDQLRELNPAAIFAAYESGNTWLLTKKNDQEGVVENHGQSEIQELTQGGTVFALLRLWRIQRSEDLGQSERSNHSRRSKYTASSGTTRSGMPRTCSDDHGSFSSGSDRAAGGGARPALDSTRSEGSLLTSLRAESASAVEECSESYGRRGTSRWSAQSARD